MKISKFSSTLNGDGKKTTIKQPVAGSVSTQETPDHNNLPPAYFEVTRDETYRASTSSPSGITGPRPILSRPTNYLTLIRENFPIRGTYRIDPTLAIPPGAIISKDKDGKELNLKFNSTNGLVEACIEIIRGAVPPAGPTRLEAVSINCDVTATIHDRQRNRFRLTAISHKGNIIVNIPPSFTGNIIGKMNRGAIKFGTEVQAQLTVLSEQNNESRYFIGDYLTTGYRDDESWLMDHLYVESHSGTVAINFITELGSLTTTPPRGTGRSSRIPAQKSRRKSFLCRLFNNK